MSKNEIEAAISVYRFNPLRIEMKESGHKIWARYEWERDNTKEEWTEPRRILPY